MGFLVSEGGGLADPANCKLNGGPCTGGGPSPSARPTGSPSTSPPRPGTQPAAPTRGAPNASSSRTGDPTWTPPPRTVTGYPRYEGTHPATPPTGTPPTD